VSSALAVGAVYDQNFGPMPPSLFGCTEPTAPDKVTCFTNSGPKLDLLAPGAPITSAGLGGGLSTYFGTSQASPHAAGLAALLLQAMPGLTPSQVASAMKTSGKPVTDARNGLTFPRIDALAALTSLGATAPGACAADATTLCLNNGRFRVRTAWTTTDGRSGSGQATALTSDTGDFWFFSSSNIEMVVKVVDGRAFNSRFWVFAGGLTNVNVVMTVTDTQTGTVRTYVNPQGTPFAPIQDTAAFASAPEDESKVQGPKSKGDAPLPSSGGSYPGPWTLDFGQAFPSAEAVPCTANATTLCLNNSRFSVRTQWATPDGRSGAGQAVALTGDTGYFWFFSSNNVEMVVKALNGCSFNTRYWVFAGGLTNVNVVMTVTDTQTAAIRTYTNPQAAPFQPIQDTNAFASCP
jgi:hypothetical protein